MENIEKPSGVLRRVISLARSISVESDFEPFKIGAVIFDKHRIYAYACNSQKTSPIQMKYNKIKDRNAYKWEFHRNHAEIACIHKLIQENYFNLPNFSKLSIFIFRQNRNGDYRLAKPCKACEAALREVGIKNIYYTGNNSIIYEKYC